jgi:hypothetical protein
VIAADQATDRWTDLSEVLLSCPNLCRVDLWDTIPDSQLRELKAYLEEVANEPVREEALIGNI